jgi:hypothetical protein
MVEDFLDELRSRDALRGDAQISGAYTAATRACIESAGHSHPLL